MPSLRPIVKRLLSPPLVVAAALLVWLEEWLWELVKILSALVAKLPPLRWYEAAIVRLPPYPTLLAFLIPGILLIPVKIGALWLVSHHHAVAGLGLIAAAKVLGTTVVARSFVLCKDKLLTIAWFKWLHDGFYRLRNRLYAAVQAMPLFQRVRAATKRWQARIAAATARLVARLPGGGRLARRFQAARRKLRQEKAKIDAE